MWPALCLYPAAPLQEEHEERQVVPLAAPAGSLPHAPAAAQPGSSSSAPAPRPLVLLLPWVSAPAGALQKYVQLVNSMGWDAAVASPATGLLPSLWVPALGAHAAASVLSELEHLLTPPAAPSPPSPSPQQAAGPSSSTSSSTSSSPPAASQAASTSSSGKSSSGAFARRGPRPVVIASFSGAPKALLCHMLPMLGRVHPPPPGPLPPQQDAPAAGAAAEDAGAAAAPATALPAESPAAAAWRAAIPAPWEHAGMRHEAVLEAHMRALPPERRPYQFGLTPGASVGGPGGGGGGSSGGSGFVLGGAGKARPLDFPPPPRAEPACAAAAGEAQQQQQQQQQHEQQVGLLASSSGSSAATGQEQQQGQQEQQQQQQRFPWAAACVCGLWFDSGPVDFTSTAGASMALALARGAVGGPPTSTTAAPGGLASGGRKAPAPSSASSRKGAGAAGAGAAGGPLPNDPTSHFDPATGEINPRPRAFLPPRSPKPHQQLLLHLHYPQPPNAAARARQLAVSLAQHLQPPEWLPAAAAQAARLPGAALSALASGSVRAAVGGAAACMDFLGLEVWEGQRRAMWGALAGSELMGALPVLFAYSWGDTVADPVRVHRLAQALRARGNPAVLEGAWAGSPHVGHLGAHPREYRALLGELLERARGAYCTRSTHHPAQPQYSGSQGDGAPRGQQQLQQGSSVAALQAGREVQGEQGSACGAAEGCSSRGGEAAGSGPVARHAQPWQEQAAVGGSVQQAACAGCGDDQQQQDGGLEASAAGAGVGAGVWAARPVGRDANVGVVQLDGGAGGCMWRACGPCCVARSGM